MSREPWLRIDTQWGSSHCNPIPFALSRSFHSVRPLFAARQRQIILSAPLPFPINAQGSIPSVFGRPSTCTALSSAKYRLLLSPLDFPRLNGKFNRARRFSRRSPDHRKQPSNLIPSSFQQGSWLSRVESSPLVCQIFPLGKLRDFPPWREIFSLQIILFIDVSLPFQMQHNPRIEFLPQVCAWMIQTRFHFYLSVSFYFQKLFEMYVNFRFRARFRVARKMHDVFSFRVLNFAPSIWRKKIGNCIYHRRKKYCLFTILRGYGAREWNTCTLVSKKCRGALSIDKAQQRRWGNFNGVNKISRVM